MVRPFEPETDIGTLRECLQQLATLERLNPSRLIKLVEKYRKDHPDDLAVPISADGVIARTTLQAFLKGKNAGKVSQLRDIWNSLAANAIYSKRLASLIPDSTAAARVDPANALSAALSHFFCEQPNVTHDHDLELMKKRLPGRYLMYRPDMRSVKKGLPDTGSISVSIIDISVSGESLLIQETQDFPDTEHFGDILQVNEGVVFPYGYYMLALLTGVEGMSFKCMVLHNFEPFVGKQKMTSFSGLLLVASKVALFPSVRFFCQRAPANYQTGLLKPADVTNEIAKAFIRTPTFPGYSIIS